jgi:hypothetical protein
MSDKGDATMASSRATAVILMAVGASLLMMAGCQTGAQTGALIGALAGAGIGQAIGGDTEGTVIGAAVGGAAGYMIGNEEDKRHAWAERARIREEMDYVTVSVRNSNGSFSRVRLRKDGIGYVGTRGEFYDHLPTSDELRPVYGF